MRGRRARRCEISLPHPLIEPEVAYWLASLQREKDGLDLRMSRRYADHFKRMVRPGEHFQRHRRSGGLRAGSVSWMTLHGVPRSSCSSGRAIDPRVVSEKRLRELLSVASLAITGEEHARRVWWILTDEEAAGFLNQREAATIATVNPNGHVCAARALARVNEPAAEIRQRIIVEQVIEWLRHRIAAMQGRLSDASL